MHISIAEVEEHIETREERPAQPLKYVAYNIHINGTYHCSVRFSDLHKLHEKLKREFGAGALEKFPPKNFRYMPPEECVERRYYLQKWLQKVAQQPLICNGTTFQTFLLNAQKEVQKGPEEEVELDVYLANGKRIKVDIMSTDQTEDVLETVAGFIELPTAMTYFFGLYLVDDIDGKVVIRKLQDFESPFISLMRAEPHQKIQLRKAYYNIQLDQLLWNNPIALNLLYIEAITELKNGHIQPTPDAQAQLDQYRSERDRKAFLELIRSQPGYGFVNFGSATTNWPEENASMIVTLGNPGNNKAAIVLWDKTSNKPHEFLVQRMRCWRTYTVEEGVEMEFEYLMDVDENNKPKMQWIKLLSEQTIHCAMCLQFMVEEMLRIAKKQPIKVPADREGRFKPRRQSDAPPDMSFLGADPNDEAAFRISVTLSDLIQKVKESEAQNLTGGGLNDVEEEDEDGEDNRNNFAAIAGLD